MIAHLVEHRTADCEVQVRIPEETCVCEMFHLIILNMEQTAKIIITVILRCHKNNSDILHTAIRFNHTVINNNDSTYNL